MISLATETERTLFFDFLPLALGQIRGFKTRFHLYTVPGQVFYDASRKLILKGVDGVVFVADSQIERMEANLESLDNLKLNLAEQGYDLEKTPTSCSTTSATCRTRRPWTRSASSSIPRAYRTSKPARPWAGCVRDAEGGRSLGAARSQADEPVATRRFPLFDCFKSNPRSVMMGACPISPSARGRSTTNSTGSIPGPR